MTSSSATAVALAAGTWAGVLVGRRFGPGALAAALVPPLVGRALGRRRRRSAVPALMAALVAVGVWSGVGSVAREIAILGAASPSGNVSVTVRMSSDPRQAEYGWWALARPLVEDGPDGVPLLLSFSEHPPVGVGDRAVVGGTGVARSGRAGGDPYAGVIHVRSIESAGTVGSPWMVVGNAVRARTLASLREGDPGRALLAGFLVGDTSGVAEADMEAMRRSGLSHLVAVSGSNVALFLGMVLIAAGPLAAGPRRRAVVGLAAIVVLVVATRWESSVVRAAVMAALALGGRLGGWVLDGYRALAVTVIVVLAVSGELATDVGFGLSVLATLGVMIGARWRPAGTPRWMATAVGATVGAQVAVAPVLLGVFGSVPLVSPLTNLVAAPVVAVSTALGAVGVGLGWGPLVDLAAMGARFVLGISRVASSWPQLGWGGVSAVFAGVALARFRSARPALAVVSALVLVTVLVGDGGGMAVPGAVVLDVGQGDSIVVRGSSGETILVDGGPDPAALEAALARYRITRIDLVVLTHVHADHATGLSAVIGRRPVSRLWFPTGPHTTPAATEIAELAVRAGVATGAAPVGSTVEIGELVVEVLGPLRRYESPNDQSVVLRIRVGAGPRLLLTGDIETYAQSDLAGVQAEILKVPHQGGATSDLRWLTATGADMAVISVGPNDYGHPAADVVATLVAAGMDVRRTDLDGDVAIPLR